MPATFETSFRTIVVSRGRNRVSHEAVLSRPKLLSVTDQKASDPSGHAADESAFEAKVSDTPASPSPYACSSTSWREAASAPGP